MPRGKNASHEMFYAIKIIFLQSNINRFSYGNNYYSMKIENEDSINVSKGLAAELCRRIARTNCI